MVSKKERIVIKKGTQFEDISSSQNRNFPTTARNDMNVELIQMKLGKTYFRLGSRICKTVSILILILFLKDSSSFASDVKIDMNTIYTIESSNDPTAYNRYSKAKGLGQITPVVLEEWNNYHSNKYSSNDLFNPTINKEIAIWYMNTRIPKLLKHYKKEDTIENRLIAYNAGIGKLRKGIIPKETRSYVKKYVDLVNKTNK